MRLAGIGQGREFVILQNSPVELDPRRAAVPVVLELFEVLHGEKLGHQAAFHSEGVLARFDRLQEKQEVVRLSSSFEPPRDTG
jgi:hypothetical protein